MRMFEFRNKGNNERKSKGIKRPYFTMGNINLNVLKYLVPWAQYDEENRVNDHFTKNNNIVKPFNEKQIEEESINNDIALKILMSELLDRQ